VTSITPNMLVRKVSDIEAVTLQDLLKQYYKSDYNEELPDITNISRDGNKLIVDAGDISL